MRKYTLELIATLPFLTRGCAQPVSFTVQVAAETEDEAELYLSKITSGVTITKVVSVKSE